MLTGNIEVTYLEFPDGSIQATAVSSNTLTVKNVTGDYTITAVDLTNVMVRVFESTGLTARVYLPSDVSVPCSVGTTVIISARGLGQVAIDATAPAVVTSPLSTVIDRKYGRVVAIKTAADTWNIDGQLAP